MIIIPRRVNNFSNEIYMLFVSIGLSSRAFVPNVKSLVGADISQGMLSQFDKRVKEFGLEDKLRSVCIELKGEEGELEKLGGEKFDVITVCRSIFEAFRPIRTWNYAQAPHVTTCDRATFSSKTGFDRSCVIALRPQSDIRAFEVADYSINQIDQVKWVS